MTSLMFILLIVVGFAAGAAFKLLRSPNENPLAELASSGQNTHAVVTGLEPDGDQPNVIVQYQVNGADFSRSLPWPVDTPLPELGTSVEVRYLPGNPGLSRLVG